MSSDKGGERWGCVLVGLELTGMQARHCCAYEVSKMVSIMALNTVRIR